VELRDEIHLARELAAVVGGVEGSRELVGAPIVPERLVELADVVEVLPEGVTQAHLTARRQGARNESYGLREPGVILTRARAPAAERRPRFGHVGIDADGTLDERLGRCELTARALELSEQHERRGEGRIELECGSAP